MWGGKRENAGRKKSLIKRTRRIFFYTDEEYALEKTLYDSYRKIEKDALELADGRDLESIKNIYAEMLKIRESMVMETLDKLYTTTSILLKKR